MPSSARQVLAVVPPPPMTNPCAPAGLALGPAVEAFFSFRVSIDFSDLTVTTPPFWTPVSPTPRLAPQFLSPFPSGTRRFLRPVARPLSAEGFGSPLSLRQSSDTFELNSALRPRHHLRPRPSPSCLAAAPPSTLPASATELAHATSRTNSSGTSTKSSTHGDDLDGQLQLRVRSSIECLPSSVLPPRPTSPSPAPSALAASPILIHRASRRRRPSRRRPSFAPPAFPLMRSTPSPPDRALVPPSHPFDRAVGDDTSSWASSLPIVAHNGWAPLEKKRHAVLPKVLSVATRIADFWL